jgi:hypothetical protein
MKTMKTLFDDYALAAMQGLLAAQDKNSIDLLIANEIYRDRLASLAFSMADLMVERRNDMQAADVI